jgi:hypothetical protein
LYLHDDRLGPFVRATFYKITDKSLELVLINESLNNLTFFLAGMIKLSGNKISLGGSHFPSSSFNCKARPH